MTHSIEQLTHKLQRLKKQYTEETAFDANELQSLKLNNRAFVRPVQEFKNISLGLLIIDISKYLQEGWTVSMQLPAGKNAFNWYSIYLTKPETVLDQEFAESDLKTEADYLESLRKSQVQLIQEMAKVSVEISELKELEKSQAKRQRDFDKALEQLKAELSAESKDTEESSND